MKNQGRTVEVRIAHPNECGGTIPTKPIQFASDEDAIAWAAAFNFVTGQTDPHNGLCATVHPGQEIPDPKEEAAKLLAEYKRHLAA